MLLRSLQPFGALEKWEEQGENSEGEREIVFGNGRRAGQEQPGPGGCYEGGSSHSWA